MKYLFERSMQLKSPVLHLCLFLLAFLSGGLIILGLAPFSFWPASIVALLIFCFSLSLPQSTLLIKQPWLSPIGINKKLAFAFSFGLLLGGCHWVYVSMVKFGGTPIWLAVILTAIFCGFIASLLLPFIWLEQKLATPNVISRSFVLAAIWVLCEWFRSWFLTGFPWLYIGYSHIDGPLANYAPYISVYGISFICAFTAMAVVQLTLAGRKLLAHHQTRVLILLLGFIWLLPLKLAPLQYTENKGDDPITVALIQPNLDIFDKWNPEFLGSIKHYLKSVTISNGAELTIWPETAVPELYHRAFDELYAYSRELKEVNQAVILGIPSLWHSGSYSYYYNTMIGSGHAKGMYHKQKLVPFGEFIPFDEQLRGLIQFFDLPMSEFRPGPQKQTMFTIFDKYQTQPYICYEVVYPEFVANTAGAQDFLLTVSNDAWFGHSIGPAQHLEIARMRALETGRYLIRATNTGMTAIIGPDGKVIEQLESFKQGLLNGKVYARKGYTPVAQYGTLAPILFSFFILVFVTILNSLAGRHKKRHSTLS